MPSSTIDCVACNEPAYPFAIEGTYACAADCGIKLFASSNDTCDHCLDPCLDCHGTATTCTQCNTSSAFPALYDFQCIKECPDGWTNINGVCEQCVDPCLECYGGRDKCTECDNSRGRHMLFEQNCYHTCPQGSCPDLVNSICHKCTVPGCDLCQCDNVNECLICDFHLFQYNGTCLSKCSDNTILDEDRTSCRLWKLSDMGVIYFPWLITAFICIGIVYFGKCKKRAILEKSKVTMISSQSSPTAVIAFIGPIQTLATL